MSLLILLFLGSWRSTIVVVASIPLAVLFSITLLSALGYSLNLMTLGGLAGVWFGMTFAKPRGSGEVSRRFVADNGSLRKVGLTAGALIAFALLLGPLGFPLTTLAFMMFLLRVIEPQRWGLALALSVVTVVLCVVVFQVWLQVQFPEGPMSIHIIRKWIF